MGGSKLKSWNNKKHGHPKTCPVSRHAAMIANDLRNKRDKRGYGLFLRSAGYDVDHMAESIEAVVVALWEARRFLEWDIEHYEWELYTCVTIFVDALKKVV